MAVHLRAVANILSALELPDDIQEGALVIIVDVSRIIRDIVPFLSATKLNGVIHVSVDTNERATVRGFSLFRLKDTPFTNDGRRKLTNVLSLKSGGSHAVFQRTLPKDACLKRAKSHGFSNFYWCVHACEGYLSRLRQSVWALKNRI